MRHVTLPALLVLGASLAGIARPAGAQDDTPPAPEPASDCTYESCALTIAPRWSGLALERATGHARLANLYFLWPRDITAALVRGDRTVPGADSVMHSARQAVRLRRAAHPVHRQPSTWSDRIMHSKRKIGLTAAVVAVSGGFGGTAARPASVPHAPGKTVEVRMIGDATGFRFAPAKITVSPSDTVRFVLASGPPHNVVFWSDSIPRGAPPLLQKRMAGTMAPLTGPLLMTPGQSYQVTFAGLPVGTYHYYCAPHLALGMTAVIRVQ